jgi:hypothetical protein
MAHAYDPSYSGGESQRDPYQQIHWVWWFIPVIQAIHRRAAQVKSKILSGKKTKAKRAEVMVQILVPPKKEGKKEQN